MMSRLVKIVDNKYVQIEEYKSPNICFNTNEYDDFEDYCTLRKTFEMFYENQELKKQYCERTDCSGRIGNSKKVEELQNENQQLKKVIDKAIKYIETCNPNVELHSEFLDESYLSNYGANELLDILKGESNE